MSLICTAIAASANWYTRVRPNQLLETVSKPLTTVLVMWVAVAADGPSTATVLAILGLVFCLLGDIALLDVVDRFIIGLILFLIGHLIFVAMFVALHLPHPIWGAVAAVVLVIHASFVGRRVVAGAAHKEPALKVPVSVYLVVIMSMAVVAAMTGNWWGIGGAFAFVLSDTLLGWRAFVAERAWMALAVMVTYHAALVGLALSLA
jgi:uncharacterized membrane protein YhhN